jgi:signal transduction histidine kinase
VRNCSATWRRVAPRARRRPMIEALLTLASSESGLNDHEPVDLASTVTPALAGLAPEIGRLGIRIDEITEPAPLDGDLLLVERLVANLLANAVRHNVADGRVEVRTGVTHGQAVLSVTNTGALIPPADVDRLFQPFQRLDRRRANYKNGHGLGLSIVKAIASAHGAAITACAGPDGGLGVSVIFPRPASPTAPAEHHSPGDRNSLETGLATP